MKENEVINDTTGEVVLKPKFRSAWENPYGIQEQDLSNEFEDVYTEIAPYAVDPKTGKFLNDSSVPKIVKTGCVNVHERIQSFAQEVDLYHILEKFAYSDDPSIINQKVANYGDISEMPDNLNDIALKTNAFVDKLTSLSPELAKMVIDDNYTAEQIEAKANEILASRIKENEVKEENK